MLTTREASVRPVMRFLISLFSSLFLHSSKPPAAAAGFLWGREGVVSWFRVDGRTGTQQINTRLPVQRRNRPSRNGLMQLQISQCVRRCRSDTVLLSSFSCLLSWMHSCSLASSSSCRCFPHAHIYYSLLHPDMCEVIHVRTADTCVCAPAEELKMAWLSCCCRDLSCSSCWQRWPRS